MRKNIWSRFTFTNSPSMRFNYTFIREIISTQHVNETKLPYATSIIYHNDHNKIVMSIILRRIFKMERIK